VDRHQQAVNELSEAERFFSAIGRFIYEFSQLEYELKLHVAGAIGLKDEHFPAIMTYDFAMLCTVAETVLVPIYNPRQTANFQALIGKYRSLNDDRNRVVHGLWEIGMGGSGLIHVPRRKLEYTVHFRDSGALARKADLANDLREELRKIAQDMSAPK
jgi:hypothetical protein